MAGQALDRRAVEEVAVVLERAGEAAAAASPEEEREVELRVPVSARPAPSAEAMSPAHRGRPTSGTFWKPKMTWKSGVARQVALRPQLLDQLLERQVLVGVGVERRRAHPSEELAEAGSPREVGAQHQGVDEEADQPLDLQAVAVGDRRADERRRPGRRRRPRSALRSRRGGP